MTDRTPAVDHAWNVLEGRVASEQLVTAEAGQRDLETCLGRRLGDKPGVKAVYGWLVHGSEERRQIGFEFRHAHDPQAMAHIQMASDLRGERRLVVAGSPELVRGQRDRL